MRRWQALMVLCAAQFLMVLDQAVMNVSISQLVEDFDTTVTVIQGVITFYALTMAALMITGGKLGDRYGRRRIFTVGLIVYGIGSALTAVAPNVVVLLFGWSILEGIGAAMVLPALVALVAGTYQGADRAVAYGVIGGVAGAGIAVGPILGGWVTTSFTWRWVFVGEVILALLIVATARVIDEPEPPAHRARIDWIGAALSGAGLAAFVFGILQASEWGWLRDRNSPWAPGGLSLAPFVMLAGLLLVGLFFRWSAIREARGDDPLVRPELWKIPILRSGLEMFLLQNLVLMGVFFSVPLYLQVVQGLDALDTGIRMLPVSVAMFVMSFVGARLGERFTPQRIVRAGWLVLLVAVALLMWTIQPELGGVAFASAMALLGIGMGLMASQLGNVVQSSVSSRDRSEAGGLQYTAQQLGSAVGTALIGAVVLGALTTTFTERVVDEPRVPEDVAAQIEADVDASGAVEFVRSDELSAALTDGDAMLTTDEIDGIVDAYADGQLVALRTGLLVVGALVLLGLFRSGRLPDRSFAEVSAEAEAR